MRSNFTDGFKKQAGIIGSALGAVGKPIGWAAKQAMRPLGGVVGTAMTVGGALMEGNQGLKKMTDAGAR